MTVSFVGSEQGVTSAAMPAGIAAGDVAVVFAYRDGSNTAPTLPSGYSNVPAGSGAGTGGTNTNSFRVGFRVLVGDETDTETWANATNVIVQVYRGVDQSTPIGDVNSHIGLGTSYLYNSLTLVDGSGASWIAGFSGIRDPAAASGVPAEMTVRENDVNAGERADGWDTNGGTANGAISDPATGVASIGRCAMAVELLVAGDTTVSPTGLPMTMALGTPTVQAGGNATVNPTGLGMTMAFGGATLVIESEGQGGLGTIRMGFGLGIGL